MKLDIQLFGGRGAESLTSGHNANGDYLKIEKSKTDILDVSVARNFVIKNQDEWEDFMRMKGLSREEAYVITDGTLNAGFRGNSVSVGVDTRGIDTKKAILTHNHPSPYGGTFSSADISMLTVNNFKEIRAVAREGTYSLKRTKGARPLDFNKALNRALPRIERQAKASKEKARESGKGNKFVRTRKAYCNVYSSWYKQNAPKYGYKYEFKPNKDYK